MNSQELSASQYIRTNRIMYGILLMSYIAFIGIERTAPTQTHTFFMHCPPRDGGEQREPERAKCKKIQVCA